MAVELSASRILTAGAAVGPVLGIDTGSPIATVGIVAEGRILASREATQGADHHLEQVEAVERRFALPFAAVSLLRQLLASQRLFVVVEPLRLGQLRWRSRLRRLKHPR